MVLSLCKMPSQEFVYFSCHMKIDVVKVMYCTSVFASFFLSDSQTTIIIPYVSICCNYTCTLFTIGLFWSFLKWICFQVRTIQRFLPCVKLPHNKDFLKKINHVDLKKKGSIVTQYYEIINNRYSRVDHRYQPRILRSVNTEMSKYNNSNITTIKIKKLVVSDKVWMKSVWEIQKQIT